MTDDQAIADFIGDIHDASLAPERWSGVLHRLSDAFDAHHAHLFVVDARSKDARFAAVSERMPTEAMTEYHRHYHTVDPRIAAGWNAPYGVMYPDARLVAAPVFEKSEFYNDFYAHYEVRWMAGSLLERDGSTISGFAIVRTPGQGPFEDDALTRLDAIGAHLKQALRVQQRIAALEADRAMTIDALDRLSIGVVLLDGNGRPFLVNRAAREIVASADGLTVEKDGLHAGTPAKTAALRKTIADALGAAGGAGGAIALPRPSMKRPLEVTVAPLAADPLADGHGRGGAIVLVDDPERAPDLPVSTLRRLYGLTSAEARVAAALATGATVREIAEGAGVTDHTVRWALKQIFAKTDTRRQAELVSLLLKGPAGLGRNDPDDR